MPVGAVSGKKFVSSSATDFKDTASIIKVIFAKRITIYKVDSFVENGKLSQFDFRTCSGITVSQCDLTNNNGVMTGNDTGSILMIRGIMQDIIIADNKFTKYGNDEIIWIAFDPIPHSGLEGGVPEAERELMVRKDIRVTNNTFTYCRPMKNDGSGELMPSNVMGVMITFESYKNTYWQNVLVAFNDILVQDVVRRVFWVQHSHDSREFNNFRFIGNKITHDFVYTEGDGYSHDFWMTGDTPFDNQEPVEIAQNVIIAAETIGKSNMGHVCIVQNGMALNVHDNVCLVLT